MAKKPKRFEKTDFADLLSSASSKLTEKQRNVLLDSESLIVLQSQWKNVVGESLASHTIPIKIAKNRLTIKADHSIFAQQVNMLQSEILKKAQPLVSEPLRYLFCSVGKVYWPGQLKVSDVMSPLSRVVKNEGHPNSSTLDDLQNQLESLDGKKRNSISKN